MCEEKVVRDIMDELKSGVTEAELEESGMGPSTYPQEWAEVRRRLGQQPNDDESKEEDADDAYVPPNEESESESDVELYSEEEEHTQEDDYVVVTQGTDLSAVEVFKQDVIRQASDLLRSAPGHVQQDMVLLLSNSISNHKVEQYDSRPLICCLVTLAVCPEVTLINLCGNTFGGRVPSTTTTVHSNGVYYVLLVGHAVAVIKRDDCVFAYDPNGNVSTVLRVQLRRIFGVGLVIYEHFNPHQTENENVLADNIFIGIRGRCACWALFCCMLLRRCTTRRQIDEINLFFRGLVQARARVLSTYLICFYMRTLRIARDSNEPRYTHMEREFVLNDIENTAFPFFQSIRDRVNGLIRQYNMQEDRLFRQNRRAQSTKRTGLTLAKLQEMIQRRGAKSLVLSRYRTRRRRNGHVVPPRACARITFDFRMILDRPINTTMHIDVPYLLLQEQLDRQLTWGDVVEWIRRRAHQKYASIEDIDGNSILDLNEYIVPSSGLTGSARGAPPFAHSQEDDEACYCFIHGRRDQVYETSSTYVLYKVVACNEIPILSLDHFDPEGDWNLYYDPAENPPYNPQQEPMRYRLFFQQLVPWNLSNVIPRNALELKYNCTTPFQMDVNLNNFPQYTRCTTSGDILDTRVVPEYDYIRSSTWLLNDQFRQVAVHEPYGLFIHDAAYRRLPLVYKVLVIRSNVTVVAESEKEPARKKQRTNKK